MRKLLGLLMIAALLSGVAATERSLEENIAAWLKQEGYKPITYDDEPATWYVGAEGDEMGAIPCIIYLQHGFLCFQVTMVTLPPYSHGDINALKDVLLAIGLENYMVKAVLNASNDVELQAEIPANDLSHDDFLLALYVVLGTADAEYTRIIEQAYR